MRDNHPEFFMWSKTFNRRALLLFPFLAGTFVAAALGSTVTAFAVLISFAIVAVVVGSTYLKRIERFRESWQNSKANPD